MPKKQYVKIVFEKLVPVRPMAQQLLILLENNLMTPQAIDALTDIIRESIKEAHNNLQKTKLIQAINILETIKQKEQISKMQEQAELADIETLLENL